MGFNLFILKQYLPVFKQAFFNTLYISLVSLFFALIVGIVGGLCRVSKNKYIYSFVSVYVNMIRSTPLLCQLYLIYFGFPYLGIRFTPFLTGVIALTLNSGAFITEIVRAGIQAIPKEQVEAALSLGMNYFSMMYRIILPQSLVIIIPPLVGELGMLIKGSSLLSIIAYEELTRAGDRVAAYSFAPSEGYLTSAFLYFIICYFIMRLSKYFEKTQN